MAFVSERAAVTGKQLPGKIPFLTPFACHLLGFSPPFRRYATVFFTLGFTSLFLHVNIRKPEVLNFQGSVFPCCSKAGQQGQGRRMLSELDV